MIDPRQPVPPPAPPPAAAVAHVPTARERQALAEVGHTALGRGVRLWLPLAFLATLAAGLLVDLVPPVRVPVELVQARWPEVRRAAASAGWLAGNRLLVGLLNDFEDALGRDSRVTAAAQPLAQRVLTGELGVGNEQVYLGRDGWLFFRRDLDYVTGPPFLAPRTVHRRSRGGDAWTAAPHPDPLPAIRELHVALRARGITLVLAPTPLKPVVHPERLSSRYAAGAGPLHNASYAAFVERVAAAGVGLVDLSAPLSRAAATGPQFLRTDTHWTPQAMDLAARELAGALAPLLGPAGGPPAGAPPRAPAPTADEA